MSKKSRSMPYGGTGERLRDRVLQQSDCFAKNLFERAPWIRPNLFELLGQHWTNGELTPTAFAVRCLSKGLLHEANAQANPFQWILASLDIPTWEQLVRSRKSSTSDTVGLAWLVHFWHAAASYAVGWHRLLNDAHGLGDTWDNLKINPGSREAAEDYFFARIRHAAPEDKADLPKRLGFDPTRTRLSDDWSINEKKAFNKRLWRALGEEGRRNSYGIAELFLVQHWLGSPWFPALCFFSDPALYGLLKLLRLVVPNRNIDGVDVAVQKRKRLGLIQAGSRKHLIQRVDHTKGRIVFAGASPLEWSCTKPICWRDRLLWNPETPEGQIVS